MRKKVSFLDNEVEMVFVSISGMPALFYDWEVIPLTEVVGREELEILLSFPDGNLTSLVEVDDKVHDLCTLACEGLDGLPGLLLVHADHLPTRFWNTLRLVGGEYGLDVYRVAAYGTELDSNHRLIDYVELDTELED